MRKLIIIVAFVISSASSMGQGFWAPGACWIYEQLHVSHYLVVAMYSGDTVIDGQLAQERTFRTCLLDWNGGGGLDTNCLSDIWSYRDYVYRQDNIVYSKGNDPSAAWDTLYYLGVPGERWWPTHDPYPLTCGLFGMLEIQDTASVVIDGVELTTWSMAYLDSAGTSTWGNEQFLGADTMAIVERIGGQFTAYGCAPFDAPAFRLLHYSDWQMTTSDGLACDIVLSTSASQPSPYSIFPNPGTDALILSGLPAGPNRIEVRDLFGRSVYSRTRVAANAPIDTSSWGSGTYFITVHENDAVSQTIRWVKQ